MSVLATLLFILFYDFWLYIKKYTVQFHLFEKVIKNHERKKERKIVYFLNTAQTYTRIGRSVGIIYRKNLTVQEKNGISDLGNMQCYVERDR
jgi:hypothetical protein